MDEQIKENLKYLGLTRIGRMFDELALKAAEGGALPADFAAELFAANAPSNGESGTPASPSSRPSATSTGPRPPSSRGGS